MYQYRTTISGFDQEKNIAGELRIFVPWMIKADNVVLFPGVPHCKTYLPSGEKNSLHMKDAGKMIHDDRGKRGKTG